MVSLVYLPPLIRRRIINFAKMDGKNRVELPNTVNVACSGTFCGNFAVLGATGVGCHGIGAKERITRVHRINHRVYLALSCS